MPYRMRITAMGYARSIRATFERWDKVDVAGFVIITPLGW
jgi:hypothetical protein